MNLYTLRYLFICIALPLLLFSCKKDKDAEPTKTDLLVANEWHGDRVLVNKNDVSDLPEIKDMLLDIKSTRLTMRRDGTYTATYNQGGAPQTTTGEWSFKEDETILYFDLLGDMQIINLTANNMDLFRTVTQNGLTVDAEVRFVTKD